jgi:hypothetical protein
MSLTRLESETGISYNDEEDTAIVYTANSPLMRRLDDLCKRFPKEFQRHILIGDDEEIKSYKIPKKYVQIRMPKVLDAKEIARRKASGERLKKYMSKSQANSDKKQAKIKDNNKKV